MDKARLRKILKIVVPLILLGIMFFLVRGIYKQMESRKLREVETPLPAFTFHRIGAGNFTNKDLDASKPLAVFFMHPECEHCQAEATSLAQNMDLFADAQVMVVSTAPLKQLEQFAVDYQLVGHDNLYVVHDSAFQFEHWFGESPFPTAIAYNRKQRLRGHFAGGSRMDIVRAKMNEE